MNQAEFYTNKFFSQYADSEVSVKYPCAICIYKPVCQQGMASVEPAAHCIHGPGNAPNAYNHYVWNGHKE